MMQTSSAHLTTSAPKRYYMPAKVLMPRAALVVGILAAMPLILKLMGEDIDGVVIAAFAVLVVICAVIFFAVARMGWMAMDANGLTYKGIGMSIRTSWDNVEAIGTQFVTNEGNVEGLKLYESGLDVNGLVKASAMLSWRSTMVLRDSEYFVPLSSFHGKDWRDSEFGQEMRRYAPRLFDGE